MSFYAHLKAALAVNLQRKPMYAELTDSRSLAVSNMLIWSERLLLPVAWYFDRRAVVFNAQGIGIFAEDFISMEAIAPIHHPPLYQNQVNSDQYKEIFLEIKYFQKQGRIYLQEAALFDFCKATFYFLKTINKLESDYAVHFAMLKHLVESIGYFALNSLGYNKISDNRTLPLVKQFLSLQLIALEQSIKFDQAAQKSHSINIGVLVNDIPDIPFVMRYELLQNQQ